MPVQMMMSGDVSPGIFYGEGGGNAPIPYRTPPPDRYHCQPGCISVIGERPFVCPVNTCCRRFTQSSSLATHLRTHSGLRPYVCARCGRAFADSSTLTKHVRVHTGVRPYRCDVCPAAFSQSGNLRRHRRIHSQINLDKS